MAPPGPPSSRKPSRWPRRTALALLLGYLAYVACSRAALRRATPKVRHCRANKAQQCCRGPEPGMVLPHLSSMKQWHSSKTRRRESITVVTQLSIERLDMLGNQCSLWPDPIAAAVYVPLLLGRILSHEDKALNGSDIGEAAERLGAFHARMEAEGACTLDLELVTEDFDDKEEAGLYPFNAARNCALMLARTEVLMLLDADFVPSPTMVPGYQSKEGYKELLETLRRPAVLVLPAFEPNPDRTATMQEGVELVLQAAQAGKARVADLWRQESLVGFHMWMHERGQAATNYSRWATTNETYEVNKQITENTGYEPYVLVARQFCPWYDERFRGYGWDKIQQIDHIAGLQIKFLIHPSGYVIHAPHKKAPTYRVTHGRLGQREKLRKMFSEVHTDNRRRRFVPVVSFAEGVCSL